jgi:hypothetical protein
MVGTACTEEDAPASDDAGTAAAVARAASDKFWNTYWGNDFVHIADVQSALQSAIDQNPTDGELYALLGATHWWHASEAPARDPHPDMNVLSQDLPTALQLVTKASQLAPDDDHLPGFVGTITVHLGRFSGDDGLVAQGDQMLDYAVYQFPEFNGFNRWAAHNTDPMDSAGYRQGLDALWHAVDLCANATVDRANPDLTPYMSLATSVGRKKVCWDNQMAPHAWEGLMLNLGNGLIKAGEVQAGRVMLQNAKLGSGYSSWPYREVLEAELASDLDARAAAYTDGDPTNDPPVTVPGRGCSYCHAKVPEH